MTTNDFIQNLTRELMAPRKDKEGNDKPGITESSATLYVKNLYNLNGKKPFKSLAFLKKTADIDGLLSGYADSTKKSILGSVVGVMIMNKAAGYNKALQHYQELLAGKSKELRQLENTNVKSDKQEANWSSMDEINKLKEERYTKLKADIGKKMKIPVDDYEALLNYLIVSLYTATPPRRNLDYMKMVVVKNWSDKLPKDVNYYDVKNGRFVFNVYKTARKYGEHIVAVPAELKEVITLYLKYHPTKLSYPFAFLVHHDGKPLSAVNSITRILNKWFGKKIGSSMLRHIYLSSKYNIDDMKKDAADMAHSVEQARGYLKSDTPAE